DGGLATGVEGEGVDVGGGRKRWQTGDGRGGRGSGWVVGGGGQRWRTGGGVEEEGVDG
ncbi:hypothetical protein U1Q18_008112, partial [Sarracenia purpurea var. burkii]